MSVVKTGLDNLLNKNEFSSKIKGNIAYLCHSASITSSLQFGVSGLIKKFPGQLKKLFGPQHGFVTDVQDNMVETEDFIHPFFKIPIHSLYSETRIPTKENLEGIDTFIIDLQDVGTRVYTYISTLGLVLEACQDLDIHIIVLDRPNPVSGSIIEGNILEPEFHSFVGHYPFPMRHGMTMGEVGIFAQKFMYPKSQLTIIPMTDYKRKYFFQDTGLTWVNPSPNLPTVDGSQIFPGSVLFEGTNISEGRGTTRSLEIFGHPKIEPFSLLEELNASSKKWNLKGFTFRPLVFFPMFQKHANTPCGGYQIHITDLNLFRPWRLGQFLCHFFYHHLGENFEWNKLAYEYEYDRLAIDLINGSSSIRKWIEKNGDPSELDTLEKTNRDEFMNKRAQCLIYE